MTITIKNAGTGIAQTYELGCRASSAQPDLQPEATMSRDEDWLFHVVRPASH